TDYGESWELITNGIPADDFTRVIRVDPAREGLLYAGTETGLYVSFDDGANWRNFQLNLPVTSIHDLVITGNDLVAGTHGRSFWILDDLTPLHQLADDIAEKAATLLQPRTTERVLPKIFEGMFGGAPGKNYMDGLGIVAAYTELMTEENNPYKLLHDSGENPPKGAVITYYLKDAPDEKITLKLMDSDGAVLREFTSMDDDIRKAQAENKDAPKKEYIPAKAGWNRFVWNLRVEDATRLIDNDPQAGSVAGPHVPPGTYQVALTVGDDTQTHSFDVVQDAFGKASQADLDEQYTLLLQIREMLSQANGAVNTMRTMRSQLESWASRNGESEGLAEEAQALTEQILNIEKKFLVPNLKRGWPGMLNAGVQLIPQITSLPAVVAAGDYRPTDQSYDVYKMFAAKVSDYMEELDELQSGSVAAFNQKVREQSVNVIG
ncbi:MAG: WD40/YVTN/BNR-like repeat-containing protein, partial [Aggregatilineales bacterium]